VAKSGPAPIIAFHGSPDATITTFEPLAHFGSQAAARARAGASSKGEGPVTVYEVALTMAHPARIKDLPSTGPRPAVHSLLRLIDQLHYERRPALLSADERARVFAAAAPSGRNSAAGMAIFADILEAHGFDSLCYTNQFEDPGSVSWIILRSHQAKIIVRRP
jgi:hypothetical protein